MTESCQLEFDPEAIAIWADRKNVCFLSDAQREVAYLRATPFLLEQMNALIKKGWTRKSNKPGDDGILFDLTLYGEDKLTLPSTFNAFLNPSMEDTWHTIFTNPWVFFAAWNEDDERDLFIDCSAPLCNIFYLLQVLAPGMLVIHQLGTGDVCKQPFSRALPRKSWMEEHQDSLEEVMRDTEAMDALITAAEDQDIAYDQEDPTSDKQLDTDDTEDFEWFPSSIQDGSDNEYYVDMWGNRKLHDYTACNLECGYCGRCDYEDPSW